MGTKFSFDRAGKRTYDTTFKISLLDNFHSISLHLQCINWHWTLSILSNKQLVISLLDKSYCSEMLDKVLIITNTPVFCTKLRISEKYTCSKFGETLSPSNHKKCHQQDSFCKATFSVLVLLCLNTCIIRLIFLGSWITAEIKNNIYSINLAKFWFWNLSVKARVVPTVYVTITTQWYNTSISCCQSYGQRENFRIFFISMYI